MFQSAVIFQSEMTTQTAMIPESINRTAITILQEIIQIATIIIEMISRTVLIPEMTIKTVPTLIEMTEMML